MCGPGLNYCSPILAVDRALASEHRLTQKPDSLRRWFPRFLQLRGFAQGCLVSSPVRLTRFAWRALYQSYCRRRTAWAVPAAIKFHAFSLMRDAPSLTVGLLPR